MISEGPREETQTWDMKSSDANRQEVLRKTAEMTQHLLPLKGLSSLGEERLAAKLKAEEAGPKQGPAQ